jgi:hypothetical protein
MFYICKAVHKLLKILSWEIDLGSLGCRELVSLHVTELVTTMVIRAKGYQLRHVRFRVSTQ